MQTIYSLALALLLAAFPQAALACSCIAVDFNTSLYQFDPLYFRAKVVRDLNAQPPQPVGQGNNTVVMMLDPFMDKRYVVQVGRVFKGCSIKAGDRLLVTSGAHSCGITLAVGADYVLSSGLSQPIDATTRTNLSNRTKMTQKVDVGSCGFNRVWETVGEENKAMLRSYEKTCP
jgi:hypothetical protein